jgi:hypothetical protein
MNIQIDRFTWVVILIVAALLAAAVVTVNLNNGQGTDTLTYRTADEPTTPVYNAYLALRKGDRNTARAQYSQRVLAEQTKNNYDPFVNLGYVNQDSPLRLRILEAEPDASDPNLVYVTIAVDRYYASGPFGGGNTSSTRRTLQVIREENGWKLDTDEYFFY